MRAPSTTIRDLATRSVLTVAPTASLRDCALAMRNGHVGSVVVVDERDPKPLGILTDRDIVVEVVAVGLDASTLTAADIAVAPLATIREDDDLLEALARMRENGVRRLPVTGARGQLVGVVSFDDLLQAVAEQLDSMGRVIAAERTREGATRA
ncbi:MAG TPA: CBS domain-containing protein [Burkholderiaceae bacterium]|nr:CBS domain-containing protein [Burkholderiaceae bacterium]